MSDQKPLSFHVPAPAVRPGGTPDFSDVQISRAGEVERPPVDVAPEKIREHAYKIIRVLNRDSQAVGPWAGLLSDAERVEKLARKLRTMVGVAEVVIRQDLSKQDPSKQDQSREAETLLVS